MADEQTQIDLGVLQAGSIQVKNAPNNINNTTKFLFSINDTNGIFVKFELSDLTDDFDLKLSILNGDQTEPIAFSESSGTENEYISKFLQSGEYILDVIQYEQISNNDEGTYKISIDTKTFYDSAILPNDQHFNKQWHLFNTGQSDGLDNIDIYSPEAWYIRSISPEVVVGVIDGGIQLDHQDLINNIWVNDGEIPNNNMDDDGNGYIDDIHGWNFTNNSNSPYEDVHGTHVAGIIGAEGNNEIGVAGVTWDVQLMSLDVFGGSDGAYNRDIWEAIYYAVDNDADVINLSLGSLFNGTYQDFQSTHPYTDNGYKKAFEYAIDNGTTVVIAAGNNSKNLGENWIATPAIYSDLYDGVISVASISNSGQSSYYTNYGSKVSIAAPGGEQYFQNDPGGIYSTTISDSFQFLQGTSMAAPVVTGAVALILGENPLLSPSQVEKILHDSAFIYRSLDGIVENAGSLNLKGAIDMAKSSIKPIIPSPVTQNNPSITSASYNISTGLLTVNGINFVSYLGPGNDINISKLAITGEGSNTYILTTPDIEITSASTFSLTLNSSDQLQLSGLLNKNGTSSGAGTSYNIAANTGWNPGAESSPADSTGNTITVSNVAHPTLNSADYDHSNGILFLDGNNIPAYPGAKNDIDVSKLSITGDSNQTYTLTSTDVELINSTRFSINLNSTDQTNLDSLLNKNGPSSKLGFTYNIAAYNRWSPGADPSINIEDLNGNLITVRGFAPTIAISSDLSSLKSGDNAILSFVLSEPSSDFNRSDISVSGGSLSNFSGSGSSYSATFTPNANSNNNAVISVASSAFSDAAGNTNNDGTDDNNSVNLSIDTTLPRFISGSTATAIDEISQPEQIIYKAIATDNSKITYSIKEDNDDDAVLFSIDSITGEVRLTDYLDDSSKNSYSFAIIATDAAGNSSEFDVHTADNINRLYNASTSRHLLSNNRFEINQLINNGWTDEGSFGSAPINGSQDVFRFYIPSENRHFYTALEYERDLIMNDRNTYADWKYEGKAFAAYSNNNHPDDALTIIRFYNQKTGYHLYSTSDYEQSFLTQDPNWINEGIAWFGDESHMTNVPI